MRMTDPNTVVVDETDLRWWLDLAPTLPWTYAKTMPDSPHRYVVLDKHLPADDFFRAVRVIRTFGEPGKFYSRTNIYLTHNDLKWWVMGKEIETNGVINQATADKVYGEQNVPSTHTGQYTLYDGLSLSYDGRYTDSESQSENTKMWKLINSMLKGRLVPTLDVGCGTGLLLDLKLARPQDYTGVDPSQGMLNELILKHPSALDLYPMSMEKALPRFHPKQFGLTVALFGAASYLNPDTIAALPSLTDGPVVLMCYEQGYLPNYYEAQSLPTADPARQAALSLLDTYHGQHYRLNHFDVVALTTREY